MEQSLKDAGYRAEHVSKTKDTDRASWKEAQVSCIAFFFQYKNVPADSHFFSFPTDLPWKK
jgi:hypothetical protein